MLAAPSSRPRRTRRFRHRTRAGQGRRWRAAPYPGRPAQALVASPPIAPAVCAAVVTGELRGPSTPARKVPRAITAVLGAADEVGRVAQVRAAVKSARDDGAAPSIPDPGSGPIVPAFCRDTGASAYRPGVVRTRRTRCPGGPAPARCRGDPPHRGEAATGDGGAGGHACVHRRWRSRGRGPSRRLAARVPADVAPGRRGPASCGPRGLSAAARQ